MGAAMSAMGQMQSSPCDMLIAAIKTAQTAQALSLIAQFPQAVHAIDSQDGATPAHWASLFGNIEVLETLAGEGVKLDASIESSGMQPVHWACTQGRTEVVKFLLARGVEINALDIKQTTPLVIAAQYDHSILVFYLVKEGADITKFDDCNDSALHWAACASPACPALPRPPRRVRDARRARSLSHSLTLSLSTPALTPTLRVRASWRRQGQSAHGGAPPLPRPPCGRRRLLRVDTTAPGGGTQRAARHRVPHRRVLLLRRVPHHRQGQQGPHAPRHRQGAKVGAPPLPPNPDPDPNFEQAAICRSRRLLRSAPRHAH